MCTFNKFHSISKIVDRLEWLEKKDLDHSFTFYKVEERFERLEKIHLNNEYVKVKPACTHGETEFQFPYRIKGHKFCRDCGKEL